MENNVNNIAMHHLQSHGITEISVEDSLDISIPKILISIKPNYCGLIANGKKTLELRKNKPKIRTPIKCYIYCTKGKNKLFWTGKRYSYTDDHSHNAFDKAGNGKIIGEFVCDSIFPISVDYSDASSSVALNEFPYTCLTDKQIMDYLGNGKTGYAWHISCLKIYEEPKELNEFVCNGKTINRPPQSWCYIG